MTIFVLIATIDEGLERVPNVLLPEEEGVRYVVSWQRTERRNDGMTDLRNHGFTESRIYGEVESELRERKDVVVTTMEGRGLCRNRNHAIEAALGCLSSPLEDAVFVIADDDERLMPEAFERLRKVYARYPKMDGALMRLRSTTDGAYFKSYPSSLVAYGRHPRSYYACSWEMTFRTRVWQTGIRFNEHFGLGSEMLCAGEEDVLLTDVLRKGLNVLIVPEDIGYTDPETTGTHLLDNKVLRSKGAVYGYQRSRFNAWLRSLREALALGWKCRTNPWSLFKEIWFGVNYIQRCKKD